MDFEKKTIQIYEYLKIHPRIHDDEIKDIIYRLSKTEMQKGTFLFTYIIN